jgi:ABC-type branched-subunit amino acid transport system substrate-binding protein
MNSKKKCAVRATLLAVSVVLLFLAGCKKGKGTEAAVVAADADGTIKIGLSYPSEGAFAAFGVTFSNFYKAFIDYVNESGEYADLLNGRKIVPIIYDDKGDGAVGKTYVEKLIHDDKVFSVVGLIGTYNLVAAVDVLASSGVPAVYFGTGSSAQAFEPAVGDQRYMMGVQPQYKTEGRLMYLRAASSLFANVKKIGVINSTADDGISLRAGIEAQYALDTRANKPAIVYQAIASTNASEIASQIQAIQDCDVILAAGNQAYFKAIYTAAFANARTKSRPIITSYVNAAASIMPQEATQPGAAEIYSAGWITMGNEKGDTEESKRRLSEMAEYWKVIDWDTKWIPAAEKTSYKFNGYPMCAYIALKTFLVGIDRVNKSGKPLTAENYLEAMESERVPIALAGGVEYKDGNRIGVDSLLLVKYVPPKDPTATPDKGAFVEQDTFTSIDALMSSLAK